MKRNTGFDVIVVGGGLSGLAAAVDLSNRGASVALVEATSKLGGRCYSYLDERTGDIIDNGQHILVGAYRHTLRYLDLIGTRSFLHTKKNLQLPLHHPEQKFATFELAALPRPLDITVGMLKFPLLTLIERRRLLNVGTALQQWDRPTEDLLAGLTIDQWLTRLEQSENAKRNLWSPIAVSIMNELPERASALLFARSLRAVFLGRKSDSEILVPSVGQTELYVSSARKLLIRNGVRVMMNDEVRSVIDGKNIASGVTLKNGDQLSSQNVISAIPYFALSGLLPEKLRSAPLFDALSQIRSSPIIAAHLWFDRDFMPMDYLGLIDRESQWLFNRRRIIRERGRHEGYVTAVMSAAYDHVARSKGDLIETVRKELLEVFPGSRTARFVHGLVIKEKRATFSPTNDAEKVRPSAVTPLKGFYLAGDWTATALPATIEGAIMSGFRAAAAVS